MKIYKSPKNVFKVVRAGLGVTQSEFAKKIKTSRVNVTRYELGIVNPPGTILLTVINLGIRNGVL